MIILYDLKGNKLMTFGELTSGNGSVGIEAGKLPPGVYSYALIANGKKIATQKMILIK